MCDTISLNSYSFWEIFVITKDLVIYYHIPEKKEFWTRELGSSFILASQIMNSTCIDYLHAEPLFILYPWSSQ